MLLSATSTITDVALSFILFSSTVQYVLYSYKELRKKTLRLFAFFSRICYNQKQWELCSQMLRKGEKLLCMDMTVSAGTRAR